MKKINDIEINKLKNDPLKYHECLKLIYLKYEMLFEETQDNRYKDFINNLALETGLYFKQENFNSLILENKFTKAKEYFLKCTENFHKNDEYAKNFLDKIIDCEKIAFILNNQDYSFEDIENDIIGNDTNIKRREKNFMLYTDSVENLKKRIENYKNELITMVQQLYKNFDYLPRFIKPTINFKILSDTKLNESLLKKRKRNFFEEDDEILNQHYTYSKNDKNLQKRRKIPIIFEFSYSINNNNTKNSVSKYRVNSLDFIFISPSNNHIIMLGKNKFKVFYNNRIKKRIEKKFECGFYPAYYSNKYKLKPPVICGITNSKYYIFIVLKPNIIHMYRIYESESKVSLVGKYFIDFKFNRSKIQETQYFDMLMKNEFSISSISFYEKNNNIVFIGTSNGYICVFQHNNYHKGPLRVFEIYNKNYDIKRKKILYIKTFLNESKKKGYLTMLSSNGKIKIYEILDETATSYSISKSNNSTINLSLLKDILFSGNEIFKSFRFENITFFSFHKIEKSIYLIHYYNKFFIINNEKRLDAGKQIYLDISIITAVSIYQDKKNIIFTTQDFKLKILSYDFSQLYSEELNLECTNSTTDIIPTSLKILNDDNVIIGCSNGDILIYKLKKYIETDTSKEQDTHTKKK